MAKPTNRDQLVSYVKTRLGEPVIEVNVSDEQIQDRVDDALELFFQQHGDAIEQRTLVHVITEAEMLQGYIEMPTDSAAVTRVYRGRSSIFFGASSWSPEYQFFYSDMTSKQGVYGGNGVTGWYIMGQYSEMLSKFFSPDPSYTYSPKTNRLILDGLQDIYWNEGMIIIEVYERLQAEPTPDDDSFTLIVDKIWSDRWLLAYVTELVRLQWGQNLSKFGGIQLIGGVTLDGDSIKREAREEIARLEDELQSTYNLPVDFLVG